MDPTKLERKIPLTGYAVDPASDCHLMVVLRYSAAPDDVHVFTAEDARSVRVLVAKKTDYSLFAGGEIVSEDFLLEGREPSSISAWIKTSLGRRQVIDESTGKTLRRLHPLEAQAVLRRHGAQDGHR